MTALHDVPAGEIWEPSDILGLKSQIERAGLEWTVCESIWMHDDIKRHGAGARNLVETWKTCLANLGRAGISTVCYNFMPVVDWTRTDLAFRVPGRGVALRFDMVDFVAYDVFVLARRHASDDYDPALVVRAQHRFDQLTPADLERLEQNIIAGLPGGAGGFSRDAITQRINEFAGLTNEDMRMNLKSFLEQVVPVAEEFGIKLAIHPDDPPFSLFGLPRIVSTEEDLEFILGAVDNPANGLTFCTGSLGARPDNDLTTMARRFADRIHFAHLRNVQLEEDGSFYEAEHLGGSTDMIPVLRALVGAGLDIPFRPDHGHLLTAEQSCGGNPGYSYLGRLKGLSELRGAMLALT